MRIKWDVPLEQEIKVFDLDLSYELTGYRPINETKGLDFKPEWFTEVRDFKKARGKYLDSKKGTKSYRDFWNREYKRCRDGLTVNGYTITGDHYYFLNYYQLKVTSGVTKGGGGRSIDFPTFFVIQYEYFHYLEMCRRLFLNACGLKARGVKTCPPL